MIYFCENKTLFEGALKYLPEKRREKADRLSLTIDKNNSVIAWLLLSYALKQPYLPDFSYYENGKPYFGEFPDVYFNLSHCKTGVVCGVSHKPIGVDIQDVRPFSLSAAKRVCNESELEFLMSIENENDKEYEFTKLWTKKESIVKQSGIGISQNMKNAIPDCKLSLKTYCYDKFVISACE